jgi:hypothetical protein
MSIHDQWPAEYLVVVDRACSQCEGTGISRLSGLRCPSCGGHGRAMLPLEAALQVLYDRGLWPGVVPEESVR